METRPPTLTLTLILSLSFFSTSLSLSPAPSPSPYPSPFPAPSPSPSRRPPKQLNADPQFGQRPPAAGIFFNDPPPHRFQARPEHRDGLARGRERVDSRLNSGEIVGLVFAGVAVSLQVVFGAFLVFKRYQLGRKVDRGLSLDA